MRMWYCNDAWSSTVEYQTFRIFWVNVTSCIKTQDLALLQFASFLYFYSTTGWATHLVFGQLLDRNCFCHLSPEEFKLFSDEKVRSTVAHNRVRFWQSIYQYFKSRSLHATQINFDKIRFSQIMFTNSDPYPIFLPAKFDQITQIQQKFSNWKKAKKSPQLFKAQNWWWNRWQFSAFEIQIFCLTGRALSYLYWKIQNPTPRRKIEFLTDCCFNFQFNLGANEYINSNVHRTASQWRKKERKKESCQKRKKESCQNNPIPICLNWL